MIRMEKRKKLREYQLFVCGHVSDVKITNS